MVYAVGSLPTVRFAADVESSDPAHNLVQALFSTSPRPLKPTWEVVRAVLLQRDPVLLARALGELQELLREQGAMLQLGVGQNEERLAVMLIAHVLAVVPFLEPEEGSLFEVPQRVAGQWELVGYRVERVELTPSWVGSPICAVGLVSARARPLLLFMGTPHPTATGALLSFMADCVPGYGVGEALYSWSAGERIGQWLERVGGRAVVYGQSLGGSLALMTGVRNSGLVDEVHAICPPAPSKAVVEQYTGRPRIAVYWAEGDILPFIGWGWHRDWQVYKVFADRVQGPLIAHVRAFPAFRHVRVVQMEGEDSMARQLMTWGHAIGSLPLSLVLFAVWIVRRTLLRM